LPLLIRRSLQDDDRDQIEVLLSDDSCEKLEMNSLYVGKNNVLYCRVKNGIFAARFSRNSYYQLAEYIEQSEKGNHFFIKLNDEKYYDQQQSGFISSTEDTMLDDYNKRIFDL